MSGITVGIDGSHNSHRALDWAVQEAATRHCGLTVLTVHPVIASWVTGNPVTVPADKGLQEKERLAVEEATEKALKDAGRPSPRRCGCSQSLDSRPRSLSRPRRTATCWSSGRAGAAASTGSRWARSAARSRTTLPAQSSSCPGRNGNPDADRNGRPGPATGQAAGALWPEPGRDRGPGRCGGQLPGVPGDQRHRRSRAGCPDPAGGRAGHDRRRLAAAAWACRPASAGRQAIR